MTQLIVQLDNEEKAHKVLETRENTEEFFSQAGLWKNRDISAESIRSKAWPERSKWFFSN